MLSCLEFIISRCHYVVIFSLCTEEEQKFQRNVVVFFFIKGNKTHTHEHSVRIQLSFLHEKFKVRRFFNFKQRSSCICPRIISNTVYKDS